MTPTEETYYRRYLNDLGNLGPAGSGYQGGGGGAAPAITSYIETYATNGFLDLPAYVTKRGQGSPASTDFITPSIINNNAMQFLRSGGSGNTVSIVQVIPAILINSSVAGLAQYAEAKVLTVPSGNYSLGPAVLLQGDPVYDQTTGNGYELCIHDGNVVHLRRASISETLLINTVTTWALNDIFRIEVRGPSSNWNIQCFKNGSLVGTYNDNNALRPSAKGYPGFFVGGISIPTANAASFGSQKWGII